MITVTSVFRLGASGLGLALWLSSAPPAAAQIAQNSQAQNEHAWIEPSLLDAAKAEGSVVVYSSTNEQEGLPLFKIFEDATGIKVQYIRNADSPLMARIAIEYRANQKAWDILQTTTLNKVPNQLLEPFDPPEAKNIEPEARDPGKRWYGLYANYNSPAYNTEHVKPSDLPKTYEDFANHPEWAGKVAIDHTDNEWLKAMFEYFGDQKATEIIKKIVATVHPVVTDGHLAMARATGAGEYWLSLNNYTNLTNNVKLAGAPIEAFALDPVALMFGQVGISAKAPHPNAAKLAANFLLSREAQQFLAKFGRIPTRSDVQDNPPGTVAMLKQHKVITALLTPDEERKWQRTFETLFKGR